MVVVSLMTVIVLGLMAMFGQTQRAFRSSMTQVDVLASGRATMDLLTRELERITPSYLANVTNFYVRRSPFNLLLQPLPASKETRTNVVDEFYFLSRENQQWSGIGYLVSPTGDGVGTLYRFYMTNSPATSITNLSYSFQQPTSFTNLNRIAEGVVHFRVRAYNTNGFLMYGSTNVNITVLADPVVPGEIQSYFRSNALPAYVEVELGILEQRTLERARSIPDLTARHSFLTNHVGQVHLFRQRVAVRNVDPTAY
ncbi:MAG: hypothetical protein HY298_04530 [Verrucomicrobia bacterium]|nr:hypothetical protein [Verrucomicrobiota bacterium]